MRAHLHQTFTIQLPCSCDAVLRAQIHVRFGGNHSYPPTHTTFSPEFFVDFWLVKSHEVHTVVVVSADASGFEKECRSPVQVGGGGGAKTRTAIPRGQKLSADWHPAIQASASGSGPHLAQQEGGKKFKAQGNLPTLGAPGDIGKQQL